MAAKIKGKEVRKVTSIRVEPNDKLEIEKSHGNFGLWIDRKIKNEVKRLNRLKNNLNK